jgi:hypothetical protein
VEAIRLHLPVANCRIALLRVVDRLDDDAHWQEIMMARLRKAAVKSNSTPRAKRMQRIIGDLLNKVRDPA